MGAQIFSILKNDQDRPNRKRMISTTPNNHRYLKKPFEDTFINQNSTQEEENCGELDDEGPFSKYNSKFLNTSPTPRLKLLQQLRNFHFAQKNSSQSKKMIKIFKHKKTSQEAQKDLAFKKKCQTQPILPENGTQIFSYHKPIIIKHEKFIQTKKQPLQKRYRITKKIAEGIYGKVYQGTCRQTNFIRIIKQIDVKKFDESQIKNVEEQIQFLKRVDHINIIKLYDVLYFKYKFYIITEHYEGPSLFNLVYAQQTALSQIQTVEIMKQILSTITYLHGNKIVHRDINLQTIVLVKELKDKNNKIKIIEFGKAKYNEKKRTKCKTEGKIGFLAPEAFNGYFSPSSDIWSCGIVFCCLLTGSNPFQKKVNSKTIFAIQNSILDFERQQWKNVNEYARDLLFQMLRKRPQKRISAKLALQHPYITGVRLKESHELRKKLVDQIKILKNLENFQRGNNLQAMIRAFLVSQKIQQEERQKLATVFSRYDKDSSGCIEKQQLKDLYIQLKGNDRFQKFSILFTKVDENKSGKIEFSEFLSLMMSEQMMKREGMLDEVFDYIDQDKNNFIEKDNLLKALNGCEDQQIQDIIQNIDQNGDMVISREQFNKYLHSKIKM